MALVKGKYGWAEASMGEMEAEMNTDGIYYLNEDGGDPEAPLTTDYSVTELTVTEAGRYWLTGYDSIDKKAGTAYPNCTEIDATDCTGDVVLVGNARNNLLSAGSGKASLWGGIDGNDTMQGGASQDMFWFAEGDDKDVIWDFTSGDGDAADVLVLYGGSLDSVSRSGKALTLNMPQGHRLTVTTDTTSDGIILYSWDAKTILKAKIGDSMWNSNFGYAEDIIYYQGGPRRDVLTLPGGTEEKLVWLDGSKEKSYVSIDVIDGSQSSGADQLAGTQASESIVGGRAEASLWGGAGSADDTLRAGTGDNLLFYGYGEGNDLVQSTYRDARIMLYNITVPQLTETSINGNTVRIGTTAGHTLTVEGKTAYFTLADGSSWKPNRQDSTWIRL